MDTVDQLLTAAKHLIAIESTADNPDGLRAAYEFMREMVQDNSKAVTIEEFEYEGKPSLLAYRGPDRPDKFDLILNAHVDVVPAKPKQYKAAIKDGKLYGRGAYDMKAAAIILARLFCEYVDQVPYALGLQVVTDEESGGLHGTQHQIAQGVRADVIICGECGRTGDTYEIANEAKGTALVEVRFRGTIAHGAYPWRGDNAAIAATNFVAELGRAYPTPTKPTSGTTLTVTRLEAGGPAHNQVPESAIVRIDCRYAPGDPHFVNASTVSRLFRSIDSNVDAVKLLRFGLIAHTDADNPLLLQLKAAAEQAEAHEFALVRRNGASDGRFYTKVGGQTIEFGIAGEHQHADDEHITLKAFENYLHTMRSFLQKTIVMEQAKRRELARRV